MPRSGTTWIGKILDSHPVTDYRHEPDTVFRIPGFPLLPDAQHDPLVLERFVSSVHTLIHPRICGKFPLFPKSGRLLPLWALTANVLLSKAAARAGLHVPIAAGLLPRTELLVWKSIESVGRLGAIARCFPQMRAVLLVRHPCGHVSSVLRGERNGRLPGADLRSNWALLRLLANSTEGRDLGLTAEDLGTGTTEEVIAWRWRIFNDHALKGVAGLSNVLVLRYEDACENPIRFAEKLLGFLGIRWDPQVEAFITHSTSVHRGAYYSTRKNPVQTAFSWRDELGQDQQRLVLSAVAGSRAAELYG